MTKSSGRTVILRINGVGHAFLRELGCDACPRCSKDQRIVANTSASLIVKSPWEHQRHIEQHVLFDCGIGVVDSLMEYGISRVDYLFITHNHVDHTGGLDRLLNSQRRTQPRSQDPAADTLVLKKPILYSTNETWKKGIAWGYPWLVGMVEWRSLNPALSTGEPIVPDATGLGIHLKVTPIPVYHGPSAFESVMYVVEFGRGHDYRKLILGWDFLHLVTQHPPPSGIDPPHADSYVPTIKPTGPGSYGYPTDDYPENRDALYAGLANPAEHLKPDELLPIHQPLKAPHELFLDGNTVTPQPYTGHASIMSGFSLIRRLNPRRTWIALYSGHEDPEGPRSDDELQAWMDEHKHDYGLATHEILVAKHGMVLTFAVSDEAGLGSS